MDRAEEIADKYLDGRLSCEVCPDLNQLIEDTRSGKMSKDEFIDIIRFHLENLDKVV